MEETCYLNSSNSFVLNCNTFLALGLPKQKSVPEINQYLNNMDKLLA